MELIDRYVVEIARYLPGKAAGDIATDLQSSLHDALEAREAAAGRPTDRAMVVALLREFGHPEAVADRYRDPRAFIGATWYPSFHYVSLTVVSILTTLKVGGLAIRAVVSPTGIGARAVMAALGSYAEAVFVGVATTAFVFAALERVHGPRETGDYGAWDPEELPAIGSAADDGAFDRRTVERGLWGSAIMLILLLRFPHWIGVPWGHQYHYAVVQLGDLGIRLPTAMLMAFFGGALLLDVMLLRHHRWTPALRRAELVLGIVAGISLATMMFTAGPPSVDEAWFATRGWPIDDPKMLTAGASLRRIVLAGLWVLLAGEAWLTARRIARLSAGSSRQSGAGAGVQR